MRGPGRERVHRETGYPGTWTLPNMFVLQGEVGMPGHKGSRGDKGDAVSGTPREGVVLMGGDVGWPRFCGSLSPILTPRSPELKG